MDDAANISTPPGRWRGPLGPMSLMWLLAYVLFVGVPIVIGGWDVVAPSVLPIVAVAAVVTALVDLAVWRSNRQVRANLKQADRDGAMAWPVRVQVPGRSGTSVGILSTSDSGVALATKRGEVVLKWDDVSAIATMGPLFGFWFTIERRGTERLAVHVLTDSAIESAGPRANRQCVVALVAARAHAQVGI